MNNKSIKKMLKANRVMLSDKKLFEGLSRFEKVQSVLNLSIYESVIGGERAERGSFSGQHHCRIHFDALGKHCIIARIGATAEEARAKIGLAFPMRRLEWLEKECSKSA